MSIFVETYNHTTMVANGFDDVEALREYIDEMMERGHEVCIDCIEVNDVLVNLNERPTWKQIEELENMEAIDSDKLDLIMQVKSLWNITYEEATEKVDEGWIIEAENQKDAFIEFYEEINCCLIEQVPQELRYYLDWDSIMHDKLIDTWECFNSRKKYLFLNR